MAQEQIRATYQIQPNTISPNLIEYTGSAPTDGQVLSYDNATEKFEWTTGGTGVTSSGYFIFSTYVPATLVANQFNVFTAPMNLTLLEVQACGSNTNDAQLKVGNSSNDAAYLSYFDIGDSSVPTRKFLASDFVGGAFPIISSGTRIVFNLDYDGAFGNAAQYYNMSALFSYQLPSVSTAESIGTLVTTSGNIIYDTNTQDINYETEVYDTDSMHDSGFNPERITINTPGKYIITAWTSFEPDVNGTRSVLLRLNGNTTLCTDTLVSPGVDIAAALNVVTLADLVQNDYITISVYQDSGSNLTAESRFAAQRMG